MSKSSLTPLTDSCLGDMDIRLIAADIDGTLTQAGKFTARLIETLKKLESSGIDVLIVTGRSAGWVNGIATYLPIVGAIAENGGLLYWNQSDRSQFLTKINNIARHRQQLQLVFQLLQSKFPQIRESEDNQFRLSDWTFDVQNLTQGELEQINNICLIEGWGFTYSTVQCHIKPLNQDKGVGLKQAIAQYLGNLKSEQIITVGDSPNDEPLFDRSQFPISVGVANILEYRDRLQHLPAYVTSKSEAQGFGELAKLLIKEETMCF